MLLQLVNFTDTQLRGIWNCLQTTYNELLSKSYRKKGKKPTIIRKNTPQIIVGLTHSLTVTCITVTAMLIFTTMMFSAGMLVFMMGAMHFRIIVQVSGYIIFCLQNFLFFLTLYCR